MSRSYRGVRPKANRVYSVTEVVALYGICRNTLSNWVQAGLRPGDNTRPQLFRGSALKWFHQQRALTSARRLGLAEFKCLSCKAAVVPSSNSIRVEATLEAKHWVWAECPDCGSRVQKILNASQCATLQNRIESNTSLHQIDEGDGRQPAGIGTNAGGRCPDSVPENERIIYAYQLYGGRFDEKTLDAHLASIRDLEGFLGGKPFHSATAEIVARYRERLIERGRIDLSRSTIRHRALHLKAFYDWLVEQKGYRLTSKSAGKNFSLPKALAAPALQQAPRAIPTSDEVIRILTNMAARTIVQRRDRAVVAFTFLCGTRASATASLRLGSVDCERRQVVQDAKVVRVKNGKSQTTAWFPIGEPAEGIVSDWIKELYDQGYRADDALFPPDQDLTSERGMSGADRPPVAPWESDDGVRRAFRRGCQAAALPYFNPHAARHYLKLRGDELCRTHDQRKAWSYNMGHENELVTEANYGKMTDQRRNEVFGRLSAGDVETDEELRLLIAYYEHELTKGTLEHDRAQRLSEERRARRREREET